MLLRQGLYLPLSISFSATATIHSSSRSASGLSAQFRNREHCSSKVEQSFKASQHHFHSLSASTCLYSSRVGFVASVSSLVMAFKESTNFPISEILIGLGFNLVAKGNQQIHGMFVFAPFFWRTLHHNDDAVLVNLGSLTEFFCP